MDRNPLHDPTELESRPEPAWLWDPDRRRVVWANRAGLAFWGEPTLIDLIDRRFGAGLEAVRQIAELVKELPDGEWRRRRFVFRPRGGERALTASCRKLRLDDGRDGLLMVAGPEKEDEEDDTRARLFSAVIDALPVALAVFDRHGSLVYANAECRDITAGSDGAGPNALAAWLGDEARARDLIDEGLSSGSASETETLATRLGPRAHRVTVRRLSAPIYGRLALLFLFDDVEDRRRLALNQEEKLRKLEAALSAAAATDQQDEEAVRRAEEEHEQEHEAEEEERESEEEERGEEADVTLARSRKARLDDDETFSAIARAIAAHAEDEAAEPLPPDEEETGAAEDAEHADDGAQQGSALRVVGGVDHASETAETPRERALDAEGLEGLDEPALVHRSFSVVGCNARFAALVGEATEADLHNANLLNLFPDERPKLFALQSRYDDGTLEGAGVETLKMRAGVGEAPLELTASSERVLYEAEPAMLMRFAETAKPAGHREEAAADRTAQRRPARPAALEHAETAAAVSARADAESDVLSAESEREDELRAILRSAADGIVTLDGAGHIKTFNPSAEAIFARQAIDVVGKTLSSLLDAQSAKTVDAYLQSVGEGGGSSLYREGREVTATRADGTVVPLFLTIGPMNVEKGPKFCAVIRDITQWKRSESELLRAREEAEQASSQKSDFLARISHELRTPLNAIIGFSEVMSEERFGPIANDRYKGYLTDIRASGEHLLSLINDLLDLSKIEAGKLDLNFTSVALASLIEQCVQLMQPQAANERVIMRVSTPDNLPPVVADERALRQILLNLLSNAIKFTPPGGQVIVSTVLDDDGPLQIRIRDTGQGMTADELEQALEPFRQVNLAEAQTAIRGTGLGLPLTKALAEANRAELRIESTPGAGTLVQVIFPPERVLAG